MAVSYSGYGVGWCETGQGRIGGAPWERRDTYIENSPFLYSDRVERRVYRRESHRQRVWSAANAQDFYERMLAWFDEHMAGGAPDAWRATASGA